MHSALEQSIGDFKKLSFVRLCRHPIAIDTRYHESCPPVVASGIDKFIPQEFHPLPENYRQLNDILRKRLTYNGHIEWDGGPRYGRVKAGIRLTERNVFLPGRFCIQVFPDGDWKKPFPELQKLYEHEESTLFAQKGDFGQIAIAFKRAPNGQTVLVIEETEPVDGYRRLQPHQRKKLDPWRSKAVEYLLDFAKDGGLLVYRITEGVMRARYANKTPSDFELDTNYNKPYSAEDWKVNPVSMHAFNTPDGYLPWATHTMNEGSRASVAPGWNIDGRAIDFDESRKWLFLYDQAPLVVLFNLQQIEEAELRNKCCEVVVSNNAQRDALLFHGISRYSISVCPPDGDSDKARGICFPSDRLQIPIWHAAIDALYKQDPELEAVFKLS